ncbi:MAG: 23S rRNA (pseudouridine(1915)-N(3))-methyltransferase RlmH [Candidatus Altiarchaeota archaeon]
MFSIICIGKLKERHYTAAADEYLRRITRYKKLEVVEFREQTDKNPDVSKRKEAKLILGRLKAGSYVVALDNKGKQASSEEFSELLKKPDVTFIIGGPDGLSDDVIRRAARVLSLSQMTFPHQLARVMLIEQIYRGYTIIGGERYHK